MFSLEDLAAVVERRSTADSAKSYTRSLLDKGTGYCARKFGEEAIETILAATSGGGAALRNEAADALYHLLVLLKAAAVPLPEVMAELERRSRQSGHEEKASRGS